LITINNVEAFIPIRGNVTRCLEYNHFKKNKKGNGYTFTLINKCGTAYIDFHIKIIGIDRSDRVMFVKKIYIDAIGGREKKSFSLPGYDRTTDRLTIKLNFIVHKPSDVKIIK